MPFNLPILLTWLRILSIPLLLAVYALPVSWLSLYEQNQLATLLFVVVALTDWADGYLARRWNLTSAFGAFLDPVADKLMVSAALIILVELGRCSALLAVIIIGREIAISALREWMASIGASKSVAVSLLGKIKTSCQLIAIPMCLYQQDLVGLPIAFIGELLLWGAGLLTLVSMAYYLACARREIKAVSLAGKSATRSQP